MLIRSSYVITLNRSPLIYNQRDTLAYIELSSCRQINMLRVKDCIINKIIDKEST